MTQLATRQETQIEAKRDIRDFLQSDQVLNQVQLAIPRHMSADRLMRVMLTGINRTPKLLECSRESILESLMTASQMGLEPDGRHGHLIPFNTKVNGQYVQQCKFMPDYKGIVALVRRSGDVKNIHCAVVYSNDEFDYEFGSAQRLKHKPALINRGVPVAVYSLVTLKDGAESFEVLSVEDVNKVRDNSKGYKDAIKYNNDTHPWISSWDEMAKKTAFKRHSKWLPLSYEITRAIEVDNEADPWEDMPRAQVDTTPPPAPERPSLPEKSKGVAAAVKEAEAALATPKAEEPEQKKAEPEPQPEPKKEEASNVEVVSDDLDFGDKPESKPTPPKAKTSLEEKEEWSGEVEVTEATLFTAGGKSGCKAKVEGAFRGEILGFTDTNYPIGKVNVELVGRLNKSSGNIVNWVTSLTSAK